MPRESPRSRKRKFRGNRYRNATKKTVVVEDCTDDAGSSFSGDTSQGTEDSLSASARKIGSQTTESCYKEIDYNVTGYRLIDLELLGELFQQIACKECGHSCLILEDNPRERQGCASHLRVRCDKCGWVYTCYSSKKVQQYFDINRRFVYAMRSIGQGQASAKRFCANMNMPPPQSPKAYSMANIALSNAAETVALESMKAAGKEIHQGTAEEIIQCGVSCDGTWQRRGYASLNGCVTTISMKTGKCLDVEVLSKVCHGCQRIERENDVEKKSVQQAEHVGKCKANYRGSAPSMETEGVKRIFQRSEEMHCLQYTEYFGDGDSKAYHEVENIYDNNVHVEKKECVGHVQKRIGTALRKLKKENKGLGGKGKLTDSIIDKLQNYYGIAIRSNSGNLSGMKSSILAILFHCASSVKRNLHHHCPDGPESWCRFKQDKANNTNIFKHGPGLPDDVIAKVKHIYVRLSDDELLKKCLDGKTQNQNESLNGMIWNRLPKQVFVGAAVLKFGVYDAVAHFNIGSKAAVNIMVHLGMDPGKYFMEGMNETNKKRVAKGNFKHREATKKRRKILRGRKKAKNDKVKEKEGTTYEAGAF